MQYELDQIEEFLRFRRQNPNWIQKVKQQRLEKRKQEKEIEKLINRNNTKKKELENIKKQHQKIKKNIDLLILEHKTQESQIDKEIQVLQKKKMEDFKRTVVAEERISHMKSQIQNLKEEVEKKQYSMEQISKTLQSQIIKYKRMTSDVKQKITKNQEWLSKLQSNRSSIQSVNIPQVQAEIQSIKRSNQQLLKQISAQQKRLKKQAQDIRKSYKDYCQKTEDRIKLWMKRCDPVVEGKKELKTLYEGISQNIPQIEVGDIELLYRNDLINLSSLCEPEFQKQLSDFFLPFSVKMQGISIQKTADKYFNQESQGELTKQHQQLNRYRKDLTQCQNDMEFIKSKIQKKNNQILEMKTSISEKKK